MSSELVIVVALYARPGCDAELARYEAQAMALVRAHGARLERAVVWAGSDVALDYLVAP